MVDEQEFPKPSAIQLKGAHNKRAGRNRKLWAINNKIFTTHRDEEQASHRKC